MRGQVLGVDVKTGDGIVSGEDGRRYSFRPEDWAARGEPAVGMQVDFESNENRALSIFPVPGTVAPHTPAHAKAPALPD
ncbi:MAG TPA: TM2 domain-containing protein, partial [Allosphingosinicella sp.]